MTDTTPQAKPVTLALNYSRAPLDWLGDYTCPLCSGTFNPERQTFNMAVKGGPIVCDDCAEKHAPPGTWAACESLLSGLEDIDTALCLAPGAYRAGLLANLYGASRLLTKHYKAVALADLDHDQEDERL